MLFDEHHRSTETAGWEWRSIPSLPLEEVARITGLIVVDPGDVCVKDGDRHLVDAVADGRAFGYLFVRPPADEFDRLTDGVFGADERLRVLKIWFPNARVAGAE
jgi:hypothetical protein